MTRGKHLVHTIGVGAIALGLLTQAAQASPFGLAPGGSGARTAAPQQARAVPLGLLAAQTKNRWRSATQVIPPSQRVSLNPSPLVAKLRGGIPAPPATRSVSRAVASPSPLVAPQLRVGRGVSSFSVSWTAVLGAAFIIALVGGLVTMISRQRPHRPATA